MGLNILRNYIKKLLKVEKDYLSTNNHLLKEVIIVINMKIGFCGTMSVGKTTLVKALKKLPEFKNYTFRTERSKYLMELGIPLNTDSTVKGQTIFLAERASELMQENIITDRTVIDVMAFALSATSINHIQAEDFSNFANHLIQEYDYLFYVSPEGVEVEDNGIRTTDLEYRKKIDTEIKTLLRKYNHKIKNFIEIKGSTEERMKQVKEALSL
jgi:nicotinamide riboside kinase